MKKISIFSLSTLIAAGCAGPTGTSIFETQQRAAPNCLERAAEYNFDEPPLEERKAKAEANRVRKLELGFAEEAENNPETHIPPRSVSPPVPVFPICASEYGVEGYCEVAFDVDRTGKPINVYADCSNVLFKREAIRAVSRAEFAPATINGDPVKYPGVVYPMSFKLLENYSSESEGG